MSPLRLRDGTLSQEGMKQALQAIQELREANLSLREKNASLAQEMIGPELPSWAPERGQSPRRPRSPPRPVAVVGQVGQAPVRLVGAPCVQRYAYVPRQA